MDKYVLIKDIGPWPEHATITDRAAEVVADMWLSLRGRPLFYVDHLGNTAELLIRNGEFTGFGEDRRHRIYFNKQSSGEKST